MRGIVAIAAEVDSYIETCMKVASGCNSGASPLLVFYNGNGAHAQI